MKKVLPALVLTSLLAVLLVPTMASAGNCLNSCDVISVDCRCDGNTITLQNPKYCWHGQRFNPGDEGRAACISAMGTTGTTGGGAIDTPEELVGLVDRIGQWIFLILLAVAGVFLIVSGFMFVTAGGNPENTTKARQMLINALIGVAIAVGAQGLKTIIINLVS